MERRTGRHAGAPADTSPESKGPSDTAAPGRRLLETGRETSLRKRLVARDERALAELVEVATPWLLNVARAMLRDEDEAEEIVTEAFRQLWQNLPSAAGEHAGLMPYLMRLTRHRAIDRLRPNAVCPSRDASCAPVRASQTRGGSKPDDRVKTRVPSFEAKACRTMMD